MILKPVLSKLGIFLLVINVCVITGYSFQTINTNSSIEADIEIAKDFYFSENYDEAINFLDKLIRTLEKTKDINITKRDELIARAYFWIGRCFEKKKYETAATSMYKKTLKLIPYFNSEKEIWPEKETQLFLKLKRQMLLSLQKGKPDQVLDQDKETDIRLKSKSKAILKQTNFADNVRDKKRWSKSYFGSIGIMGGYAGSGFSMGGSLGFYPIKYIGVELGGFMFPTSVNGGNSGLSDGELKSSIIEVSLQGRIPIRNKFIPYFTVGIDYYFNKYNLLGDITQSWESLGFSIEESVENKMGYHFGIGFEFIVSSLCFNIETRYLMQNPNANWTITELSNQISVTGSLDSIDFNTTMFFLGIRYLF